MQLFFSQPKIGETGIIVFEKMRKWLYVYVLYFLKTIPWIELKIVGFFLLTMIITSTNFHKYPFYRLVDIASLMYAIFHKKWNEIDELQE